jgi:hypothetical protein
VDDNDGRPPFLRDDDDDNDDDNDNRLGRHTHVDAYVPHLDL